MYWCTKLEERKTTGLTEGVKGLKANGMMHGKNIEGPISKTRKNSYILARNAYVKIGEEQKHENIIDKCREQPKPFYRHINKKLKDKRNINQLRDEVRLYEKSMEISKLLIKSSNSIYRRHNVGTKSKGRKQVWGMRDQSKEGDNTINEETSIRESNWATWCVRTH